MSFHTQHHQGPPFHAPGNNKGVSRNKKLSTVLDPWYKQAKFLGWLNTIGAFLLIQVTITSINFYFGDKTLLESFSQALEWYTVGLLTFAALILVLKLILQAMDKFDMI